MNKFLLAFLCFAFSVNAQSQKFEGIVTFSIEYPEIMLNTVPPSLRDSVKISRKYIKGDRMKTENFTSMGKQILIETIGSDTSYLLFNLMGEDIAVEIVGTSKPESKKDSLVKKGNGPKIHNLKCKKASYTKNGKEYEVIYTDQIDSKYGNSFTALGGFALKYPIVLSERETLFYECTEVKETGLSNDVFSIPSNFRIVSMEEFGKMIGG